MITWLDEKDTQPKNAHTKQGTTMVHLFFPNLFKNTSPAHNAELEIHDRLYVRHIAVKLIVLLGGHVLVSS